MIDTRFAGEVVGNTVVSSAAWASGSGTGMKWLANGNAIEAGFDGAGSAVVIHETKPAAAHQAVEIQGRLTAGSVGVVGRWQDENNHVLLALDATTLSLWEYVGGVPTTTTWAVSATAASVRLELVGRRARVWVETTGRPVDDRPPDYAVALSGQSEGDWGMYAANDGRIVRFGANDLPSAVAPPPHLSVAAATGYNLVPITVALTGVSGSAVELEWEVYPADPQDFPEAYRDVSVASLTSRVLWVRPGYPYDVRVRERKADGSTGAWTGFDRIDVPGYKAVEAIPTLPTVAFPAVAPDYVLTRQQETAVVATVSETGRERVSSPWLRPRQSLKLVFEDRTSDELQELIDFFDEMRGQATAFTWTHPTTGEQLAMRFAQDDYDLTFRDRNDAEVIGSIEFEIIEVWLGATATLTVTLELDDDLQ